MKITIEGDEKGRVVSASLPGDDHDIGGVGDLVRSVLLAWGFTEATVDELIEPR